MYNGNKTFSWFSDNPKPLLDEILKPKYSGYQVYAYNLSMLDIIFLFKYIASLINEYKIDILKKII